MSDYCAPVAELEFLLRDVLRIDELFRLPDFRDGDWDLARSVLAEGARLVEQQLVSANADGDRQGAALRAGRVQLPRSFHAAWSAWRGGGWLGLDLPPEHGGQGLPRLLQAAFADMANGACVSFCMLPLMSRAGARLLLAHAETQLASRFVPGLIAGDIAATICISEPQAGSDVGRIQARAVPDREGSFRISGTKAWISYGDHELTPQIAHMVLARRRGAPAGTRGLGLYLVPKRRGEPPGEANGVSVVSLEHKMGLRASPTCVLGFDAAVGYPVGPEGRGLHCLFTMVNTMRLEVALQGVALAGAATAAALRYAGERRQGGPANQPALPIIHHPDVRRMLMTMLARTGGLRALTLETARQLDLAEHHPDPASREQAAALAGWLLPICKACATDAATEVANLALQVHGACGYVQDTGIEQIVRDARVGAIYEGTNGIQALDLVSRRLVDDDGRSLGLFAAGVRASLAASAGEPRLEALRVAVDEGIRRLERCADHLRDAGRHLRDRDAAATPFLRLAGLVGCAWMWLRIAAASGGEQPQHRHNCSAAGFFAGQLLPEGAWLERQVIAGAADLDTLGDEELSGLAP